MINFWSLEILKIQLLFKNLFSLFFSPWFERGRKSGWISVKERKSSWHRFLPRKRLILVSTGIIRWEEFYLYVLYPSYSLKTQTRAWKYFFYFVLILGFWIVFLVVWGNIWVCKGVSECFLYVSVQNGLKNKIFKKENPPPDFLKTLGSPRIRLKVDAWSTITREMSRTYSFSKIFRVDKRSFVP